MPQPRSARFDQAQKAPHVAIVRADIEDGAGNVVQRDVPMLPDGEVTADKTAANALVRDLSVPLNALNAAALDLLQNNAANACIRTFRGIRYEDTVVLGTIYNSAATWTPSNGGVMNGCTVNSSGYLQMGP